MVAKWYYKKEEVDNDNNNFRIDEETYEKLAKLANNEERSINSEILYIIKQYLLKRSEKIKETVNN